MIGIPTHYKEIFKDAGCKLIDTHYINSKCRLKYEATCGHTNTMRVSNFKRGLGRLCKECSVIEQINDKRLTLPDISKYLESNGCKLLSGTYVNNKDTIKFIGKCGHEATSIVSTLKTGKLLCKECNKRQASVKGILEHTEVSARIAESGCELLSTYINAKTPMNIKGTCGHLFSCALVNFDKHSKLCFKCMKEIQADNLSFSNAEVNSYLKSNNCELISPYINNSTPITYKTSCGHTRTHTLGNIKAHKHFKCIKCSSRTKAEDEIAELLSNYTEVITNSRKVIAPLELDVYLPEFNLAIEYNGIYWHSESRGKDKKYHINKTKLCKDKGIQLIHIFENEWLDKPEVIKSILLNKIGQIPTKLGTLESTLFTGKTQPIIYARNTTIKEVNSKDTKEFLDTNHRQGSIAGSIKYGLYYSNELVSIMTFRKNSGKYDLELSRFCNKLFVRVVGGASKLYKHFRKNHTGSVVTYADLRYSDGGLYSVLGFNHTHNSPPNYWYFKNSTSKLESRVQFQKHKLKDKLSKFDEAKTEYENMKDNNYDRIWDCGNMVFVEELND